MRARVRMYRVGLGDCVLLTLAGSRPVHVLVDCGTIGSESDVTLAEALRDIQSVTGGRLDALVLTHAHRDHLSALITERAAFDALAVDRLWLPWAEDPRDRQAARLRRYRREALHTIALGVNALQQSRSACDQEQRALAALAERTRNLLAFYADLPSRGAVPGDLAEGIDAALQFIAGRAGAVEYLGAGRTLMLEGAPDVRIRVLGPPRDAHAIFSPGEQRSPSTFNASSAFAEALANGVKFHAAGRQLGEYRDTLDPAARQVFERFLPFDTRLRLERPQAEAEAYLTAYDGAPAAWRRVDHDWLIGVEDLAVQLDNVVNNTSVVLAVELEGDGSVVLLPGDAQPGSWATWPAVAFPGEPGAGLTTVTGAELLRRTRLYKAAHHGTDQGTSDAAVQWFAGGLTVLIPVDESVAQQRRPPWHMPAAGLYHRLREAAGDRVFRSDRGWGSETVAPARGGPAAGEVEVTRLYVEVRVR